MLDLTTIPLYELGVELRREPYCLGSPLIWALYRNGARIRGLNKFECDFVDSALAAKQKQMAEPSPPQCPVCKDTGLFNESNDPQDAVNCPNCSTPEHTQTTMSKTPRSPFDNPIGHDPKPELRTRVVIATTPLYVINGTKTLGDKSKAIPVGVTRLPTTADRLIKKRNITAPYGLRPFFEVEAIQVGEVWYAPFSAFVIQPSTEEDLAEQQRLAKRELVLEKIKQSGLSEEELELLRN